MNRQMWTREAITEVIKQCRSMNQFREKYGGAYYAMKRNKWDDLKELIVRTINVPDNRLKWTPEHILELTKECTNINDFCRKYPRAYEKIKNKNWYHLLDGIRQNRAGTKWTREMISKLIAKCDSLYEFRIDFTNAYQAMLKNGWHDLAAGLSRKSVLLNETSVWSVYRWYFPEYNAVYIGLSKNFKQRIKDELRYRTASPIKDFLDATGSSYEVNEIYTGLTSDDAARLEIESIKRSKDEGYRVLNRNKGGTLGGGHSEPTYTKVYIIAKYNKDGKYCGSEMRETGRSRVEAEAMQMEMNNECCRAEVIPVIIPWRAVTETSNTDVPNYGNKAADQVNSSTIPAIAPNSNKA